MNNIEGRIMDFRTLKTFLMIVKYGSFNRAAEEMNYVQSTVTMQMQKLETELGMKLIERGKTMQLSEAGRLFHEESIQIVKRMEKLETDLADLQRGEAGHVRVGVTEPSASYRLPSIIQRFMAQYPKIKISLVVANTPTLTERLLECEIDLALCSAPDLGSDLYYDPLFKEEFVVLLPEHHPLTLQEFIAPVDLRDYRLLITSATCPYRRKLEMVLHGTGKMPLETMEIGSITALQYYVECG